MEKGIITVVGKDQVGIISRICSYLASNQINILDITQTIIQGYFNMMMVVDITNAQKDFDKTVEELHQLGDKIGVKVNFQHESIFQMMHRI